MVLLQNVLDTVQTGHRMEVKAGPAQMDQVAIFAKVFSPSMERLAEQLPSAKLSAGSGQAACERRQLRPGRCSARGRGSHRGSLF